MSRAAMDRAEFERALRDKGRYYHIHHPFHVAMYEGRASREQIQGWVANRFYYQVNIPLKDAAILANCPDREVRREWIQRILDHDGAPGEAGGIEAWLRLAEAVGLEREQVLSEERVLPGVRFAVDAYVNFARRASWREAASSSLTELFARRSTSRGWTAGRATIRGSRRPATSISAVAWPRPGATSSTACGSPWSTIGPARHRNACWISCNSSWTCCGACSTR